MRHSALPELAGAEAVLEELAVVELELGVVRLAIAGTGAGAVLEELAVAELELGVERLVNPAGP
jgi:hypothetical protein